MAVTLEKIKARVYLVGLPANDREAAKSALGMGGKNFDWDRKQWFVGTAKFKAAQEFVEKFNSGAIQPAVEDINDCRVYAKVEYQGHKYYVIGQTMTQATATQPALPLRVRLVSLNAGSQPFWTDAQNCKLEKEYRGREERGAYGRPTGRTVYTTLGNIRSFVTDQRAKEAAGVPQCAECGLRNHHLIVDNEDGMMKCNGCCDLPSE
jgi:hypothetical protein